MQTERGINLPLDEVYVSLTAERRELHSSLADFGLGEDDREPDTVKRERKQESVRSVPVELEAAVSQHARLVFLGDPGAGKTTLMRFLALRFALAVQAAEAAVVDREGRSYGETRLPILVRVAEFADAFSKDRSLSVRDFLPRHHCGDLGLPEAEVKALYEAALGAGNALILLDGLDEVVSAADRAEIGRRIDSFVAGLPHGNRVIVTSRIMGYREVPLSSAFSEHTLRDMSIEQIERFLQRWCPAHEKHRDPLASEEVRKKRADDEAALLIQAVKDNPGVKRLATNPLLLTILALIHRNGSHLPKRRIELYRIASETLLRDWQLGRGTDEKHIVEDYEALELLAPLAYWMHCHEPTGLIEKQDAKDVLTQVVMKTRQYKTPKEAAPFVAEFLRKVEQHTGIFVERAPGRYGFMHLTFEEYFAARYLVDDEDAVVLDRIQHLKHHPRWEEPIRLAIAFERPKRAAKLVREAILQPESKYEKWLCRDLLLAARCLGDCNAVSELLPLLDEVGLKLIPKCFMKDETPGYYDGLRNIVKLTLPAVATESVIAKLIIYAKDDDSIIRQSIALVLSNIASDETISTLHILANDKDPYVQLSAAEVLLEIGAESDMAINVLLTLADHDSSFVRRNVATALGNVVTESTEARNTLLKLANDHKTQVRKNAVDALSKVLIGDNDTINTLISLAKCKDEDPFVRFSTVSTLAKIGIRNDYVREALILLANDDDYVDVGLGLSYAIVANDNIDTDPIILTLMCIAGNNNPYVKVSAAGAILEVDAANTEAINIIFSLINNEDQYIRQNVANALGDTNVDSVASVITMLSTLSKDKDSYVRVNAANALLKIDVKNAVAVNTLLKLATDKNNNIRKRVAWALSNVDPECDEAVDMLFILAKDNDKDVQRSAIGALVKIGKAHTLTVEWFYSALEASTDFAEENWYGMSESAGMLRTEEVEAWAQTQTI